VRATDGAAFVPHLAIAVGVALAIASIAILIYFIHHTARSIRIETLLASLAEETRETIERLYPERVGRDAGTPGARAAPPDLEAGSGAVESHASGYVQFLDEDALMSAALEHDLVVRIEARPGCFVVKGDRLLSAFPAARVTDAARDALRTALVVGDQRAPEQDLDFAVHRIVEIAQRALSPGVNDPSTAIYCIDRLEEAFVRLAQRAIPSPVRLDDRGCVRVMTEVTALEDLAVSAFAAVARYGAGDADVVGRLLAALSRLMREVGEPARTRLGELRERIRHETAAPSTP
jgi:uncharacterized membrane protein